MDSVFYLGACSPKGFRSHYDSLLGELSSLTVIKGGSGCGKSTFMRAVARAAREHGLDVSEILCSSDPDSLDAVIVPALSLGFVDGTAPHVLEPKICGGSMNYLNFGAFYDRAAMRANEAEIAALQAKNAAQYRLVTACLASADRLLDCVRAETETPCCREESEALAECLALSALRPRQEKGSVKRRLLTAVTPKGLQFCTKTPSALCERVYVLRDNYGLAPKLLQTLLDRAEEQGHDCIVCYSPLLPDGMPTHLLIPSAGAAFVSESRDFPYDGESFCRIDLDSTLPPVRRKELEFCCRTVTELLYRSVFHLRAAKQLHDRMEQLARPFVDYEAVTALTEKTVARIFEKNRADFPENTVVFCESEC